MGVVAVGAVHLRGFLQNRCRGKTPAIPMQGDSLLKIQKLLLRGSNIAISLVSPHPYSCDAVVEKTAAKNTLVVVVGQGDSGVD